MKETARVIVTYRCDRHCPGCCNTQPQDVKTIHLIEELKDYEEIVVTGGEPLLEPELLIFFIKKLRKQNKNVKVFLYTACLDVQQYKKIAGEFDGITVTLHAECNDNDILKLKDLSEWISEDGIMRLFIDQRVYNKYDLSNIDLSEWNVIRKLEWKENCKPAPNEDLLFLSLF